MAINVSKTVMAMYQEGHGIARSLIGVLIIRVYQMDCIPIDLSKLDWILIGPS